MTSTAHLPAFEQHDVAKAAVRITNAGDGLSEALKVEPKAIDLGEEVFYVLRGECTQVNHKIDGDEVMTRLHTIKASQITEVEESIAQKILTEAAEELQRRQDEISGQLSLQAEQEAEQRERADLASTGSARDTQRSDVPTNPFEKP